MNAAHPRIVAEEVFNELWPELMRTFVRQRKVDSELIFVGCTVLLAALVVAAAIRERYQP